MDDRTSYDPDERAREKQAARERDRADVESGRRSADEVNRANSLADRIGDRFDARFKMKW